MNKKLILASASPRRQALLSQVGISFQVVPSNVDESLVTTSNSREKVQQLAALKGKSIPIEHEDTIVLSADTLVVYNGNIFEKPQDKQDAYKMISSLNGNIHEVFTGVSIRSLDKNITFVERTEVEFWPLANEEVNAYINTDEPYDKAGAYGIQSLGSIFVKKINGDYNNVVGLPLSRVVRELHRFGMKIF